MKKINYKKPFTRMLIKGDCFETQFEHHDPYTVTCVLSIEQYCYVGIAKCLKEDIFDKIRGERIAFNKAFTKYRKSQITPITKCLKETLKNLEYEKMQLSYKNFKIKCCI